MRTVIAAFVLAMLPGTAIAADWYEAETDRFIVVSRDGEDDTRDLAIQLERFDQGLRALQQMDLDEPVDSRANKLTVYRFGDTRDISRMAGMRQGGILGFYIPGAGKAVSFVPTRLRREKSAKMRNNSATRPDIGETLMHEYTHHFMMQHFPSAYPGWYVEGYAELMGTVRLNDDGSFHLGDVPQDRAALIYQLNDFKLTEMLDEEHEMSGFDWIQQYGTGWLLTHYLSFSTERQGQLREYLVAIANGEDSLTAAQRVFGDLKQLQKELSKYKRSKFPGYQVDIPNYKEPEVSIRKLSEEEVAVISERMRLHRGPFDEDDAKDIANDARSALDKFPSSSMIRALAANAEVYAEDYEAAEAIAKEAVALNDQEKEAWLALSLAAIQRADEAIDAEDKDKASQWAEEARGYAAQAANIDSADPRPLMYYFSSYIVEEEEAPETAIIALEQAFSNAGSDPIYRMMLGRQLLVEERASDALAVLLPIAFRSHSTGEDELEKEGKPTLRKLVETIESGQTQDAVAMIDEIMSDDDEEDEGEEAELG